MNTTYIIVVTYGPCPKHPIGRTTAYKVPAPDEITARRWVIHRCVGKGKYPRRLDTCTEV
jgi:hypothetical protein